MLPNDAADSDTSLRLDRSDLPNLARRSLACLGGRCLDRRSRHELELDSVEDDGQDCRNLRFDRSDISVRGVNFDARRLRRHECLSVASFVAVEPLALGRPLALDTAGEAGENCLVASSCHRLTPSELANRGGLLSPIWLQRRAHSRRLRRYARASTPRAELRAVTRRRTVGGRPCFRHNLPTKSERLWARARLGDHTPCKETPPDRTPCKGQTSCPRQSCHACATPWRPRLPPTVRHGAQNCAAWAAQHGMSIRSA